jgi:peroxiredoxin
VDTLAPELQTSHWLNTPEPITLASLIGKVVVIEAFQMLCPGCVSQGLPQASRVAEAFNRSDVVVLGLHCVFEHHAAQGSREALAAFLHEYRIRFPVAIDAPSENSPIPRTMTSFQLQGTPSMLLIDRSGELRHQHFGTRPDLLLGAEIMTLVSEKYSPGET